MATENTDPTEYQEVSEVLVPEMVASVKRSRNRNRGSSVREYHRSKEEVHKMFNKVVLSLSLIAILLIIFSRILPAKAQTYTNPAAYRMISYPRVDAFNQLTNTDKAYLISAYKPTRPSEYLFYLPMRYWIHQFTGKNTPDLTFGGVDGVFYDVDKLVAELSIPLKPMNCFDNKKHDKRCFISLNESMLLCNKIECDYKQLVQMQYNEPMPVFDFDKPQIVMSSWSEGSHRLNCDVDEPTYGVCMPYTLPYIQSYDVKQGTAMEMDMLSTEIAAMTNSFQSEAEKYKELFTQTLKCVAPAPVCRKFINNRVCVAIILFDVGSTLDVKLSTGIRHSYKCMSQQNYGVKKHVYYTQVNTPGKRTDDCLSCHFKPNYCACRETCGIPCGARVVSDPLTSLQEAELSCDLKVNGSHIVVDGFVDSITHNSKQILCNIHNCTFKAKIGRNIIECGDNVIVTHHYKLYIPWLPKSLTNGIINFMQNTDPFISNTIDHVVPYAGYAFWAAILILIYYLVMFSLKTWIFGKLVLFIVFLALAVLTLLSFILFMPLRLCIAKGSLRTRVLGPYMTIWLFYVAYVRGDKKRSESVRRALTKEQKMDKKSIAKLTFIMLICFHLFPLTKGACFLPDACYLDEVNVNTPHIIGKGDNKSFVMFTGQTISSSSGFFRFELNYKVTTRIVYTVLAMQNHWYTNFRQGEMADVINCHKGEPFNYTEDIWNYCKTEEGPVCSDTFTWVARYDPIPLLNNSCMVYNIEDAQVEYQFIDTSGGGLTTIDTHFVLNDIVIDIIPPQFNPSLLVNNYFYICSEGQNVNHASIVKILESNDPFKIKCPNQEFTCNMDEIQISNWDPSKITSHCRDGKSVVITTPDIDQYISIPKEWEQISINAEVNIQPVIKDGKIMQVNVKSFEKIHTIAGVPTATPDEEIDVYSCNCSGETNVIHGASCTVFYRSDYTFQYFLDYTPRMGSSRVQFVIDIGNNSISFNVSLPTNEDVTLLFGKSIKCKNKAVYIPPSQIWNDHVMHNTDTVVQNTDVQNKNFFQNVWNAISTFFNNIGSFFDFKNSTFRAVIWVIVAIGLFILFCFFVYFCFGPIISCCIRKRIFSRNMKKKDNTAFEMMRKKDTIKKS